MPAFKIQEDKKSVVENVTFDKKEDYMVVELKLRDGQGKETGETKQSVVHVVQGKNLIKQKKATEVKGAKIKEKVSARTVQKIEEDEN